jgi:hypothetical protein
VPPDERRSVKIDNTTLSQAPPPCLAADVRTPEEGDDEKGLKEEDADDADDDPE